MRIIDPSSWPPDLLVNVMRFSAIVLVIACILAVLVCRKSRSRGEAIRVVSIYLMSWALSTGIYGGILANSVWQSMVTENLERSGFSVTTANAWTSTVTVQGNSSCPPVTLGAWITETPYGYRVDTEQTELDGFCA